jgi:hypothetical protein
MGLNVSVDLSAYPQGIPVGIVGIGVVENGGTIEVDPNMEQVFFTMNNNTIENVLGEMEEMEVSGNAEFETPEGWEAPVPPEQPEVTEPVQPVAPSFGTTVTGTTGTTETPPTEEGDG